MTNCKKNVLNNIDALRAFAALSVLLYHLVGEWREKLPGEYAKLHWLTEIFWQLDFGKIGVLLFFLVSGYLIPFTTKNTGIGPALIFLKRRAIRVFPMFAVSILIGVLVLSALGSSISVKEVLLNVVLLPNFFESKFILGIYWTLQIELFFYLIIFLVMTKTNFYESPNLAVVILLSLTIISESLRSLAGAYVNYLSELSRVFGFTAFIFLGVLFRLLVEGVREKAVTIVTVIYLFHEFIYRVSKVLKSADGGDLIYSNLGGAISICLFVIVMKFNWWPKVVHWIGKISYSMYLTHGMILWIMIYAAQEINKISNITVGFVEFAVTYISISILIASILYYGVESKMNSRRPEYT